MKNLLANFSFLFPLIHPLTLHSGEPALLSIVAPKPYQVIQRSGFDPTHSEKTKPGSPAFGYGDILIQVEFPKQSDIAVWEFRTILLTAGVGREIPWTRWDKPNGSSREGVVRMPAGGWYRLEIRGSENGKVFSSGSVEPIGVGEVFLVAGQSYATNCNDERMKVLDPQGRVLALDSAKNQWGIAHDPQPAPDNSDGGSIWPPLGEALLKEFQVPIGFANVAVGATSSSQWLPEGKLHPKLVSAGKTLGRFRAVLWQQGESDVIAKTSTDQYVTNLKSIRTSAVKNWNYEAPWILAKSTHHPTVYNDPQGEGRIRSAIDQLAKHGGFIVGPDTDTLTGENRGDAKSRRHFSGIGQRRAAEMWLAVLKQELNSRRPIRESLVEWKLIEPAWASPVVNRQSSVLLQMQPNGPITARLAFPAAAIGEVLSADGQHRFNHPDFTLSKDGKLLTFTNLAKIEPIKASDFFLPKDSPNSYRHRSGHPDQYLLYRPGRWFHDRNIEITYQRREVPMPSKASEIGLPKTLARLRAGKPLTLGISGDSISTGADASVTGKAPPYQPGFPDLVAAQLESTFQANVLVKNRAVGGWSVANGVTDLDQLLKEKPNLILVAYGMNDVGRRDPKWFGDQTRKILGRIKAADQEIEVILVSSMLGHKEWIHTPREMFAKYRDELKSLTGPGVVLADVTAVWQNLLENLHDFDLTGNGLNHPNDFGHRLYAQAILTQLIGRK